MIDELLRRTARAAWWNTVITPMAAAVSFLGSLWIIRSLAQEDFGLYVLVIASAAGLSTLADLGTSRAAARLYPDLRRETGKRGVVRLLAVQMGLKFFLLTALGLAVLVFGDRFSGRLSFPAELRRTSIWALVMLIAGADSARDSLRACWSGLLEQFIPNVVHFAFSVIRPLLVVLCYRSGGVSGALAGLAAASAARSLMLAIPLAWWRAPRPGGGAIGHVGRRMAKLSAMNYVDKVGTFLTGPAFLVLAGASRWSTEEIAGIWAALDITSRAITLALAFSGGILVPAFAEVAAENRGAQRAAGYSFALRMHAVMASAAGAALAVGARSAIPVLCRDAYAASGVWASVAAPLLAVHYALFPPANAVAVVSERFRGYALARSVSVIAVPVYAAAAFGSPLWGIVALGCLHCVEAGGVILGARRIAGVRPPWVELLAVGIVGVAVVLALSAPGLRGLWWPVRMVLAFGACLAGSVALGVFSRRETQTVLANALPRFRRRSRAKESS